MWYLDYKKKRQDFYRKLAERKRTSCPGSLNVYQDIEMVMKSVQFNIDISYREDRVGLHSHAFYELVHVVSGQVEYILNEKRIGLHPGDTVWIPPAIAHCPVLTGLEGGQPYERKVMWADRQLIQSVRISAESELAMLDEACVISLPPQAEKMVSDLVEEGYESQKDEGELSLLGRKITACRLIHLIVSQQLGMAQKRRPKEDVFDRVNEYISANLSGDLSIDVLCAQACLSRQALGDLFRSITGMGVHQWVTRRRLMHARVLMASGSAPTKIWEECGFQDYSGFYRAFTRLYGFSPREYQKLGF